MRHNLLQAIHIKLMPSKLLLGLLLAISIVACSIIVSLPIALDLLNSSTAKLLIITLILLTSTYFILRDALLMLPWSWQRLEVNHQGELTITNKRGQQFQPVLASSTFIHAACTILNFKRNRFKFALPSIILFAHTNYRDDLRRLRIWLRWFKRVELVNQEDLIAADLAA